MGHRVDADAVGGRTVGNGRGDHLAVVGVHTIELVSVAGELLLEFLAARIAAGAAENRLGADGNIGSVSLDSLDTDAFSVFKDQVGRFGFEQVLAAHFYIFGIGGCKVVFREGLVADIGGEDRPLAADKADRRAEGKAVALQPVTRLPGFIDNLGNHLRFCALHAINGGIVTPGLIEGIRIDQQFAGSLGVNALNRILPIDDLRCYLARCIDVGRTGGRRAGAAPLGRLVDGKHGDAGFRRSKGRRRAGRSHADDEDVGLIGLTGIYLRDRGVHAGEIHPGVGQGIDNTLADAVRGRGRTGDSIDCEALAVEHTRDKGVDHRLDKAVGLAVFADFNRGNPAVLHFNRDGDANREVKAEAFSGIGAVRQGGGFRTGSSLCLGKAVCHSHFDAGGSKGCAGNRIDFLCRGDAYEAGVELLDRLAADGRRLVRTGDFNCRDLFTVHGEFDRYRAAKPRCGSFILARCKPFREAERCKGEHQAEAE